MSTIKKKLAQNICNMLPLAFVLISTPTQLNDVSGGGGGYLDPNLKVIVLCNELK